MQMPALKHAIAETVSVTFTFSVSDVALWLPPLAQTAMTMWSLALFVPLMRAFLPRAAQHAGLLAPGVRAVQSLAGLAATAGILFLTPSAAHVAATRGAPSDQTAAAASFFEGVRTSSVAAIAVLAALSAIYSPPSARSAATLDAQLVALATALEVAACAVASYPFAQAGAVDATATDVVAFLVREHELAFLAARLFHFTGVLALVAATALRAREALGDPDGSLGRSVALMFVSAMGTMLAFFNASTHAGSGGFFGMWLRLLSLPFRSFRSRTALPALSAPMLVGVVAGAGALHFAVAALREAAGRPAHRASRLPAWSPHLKPARLAPVRASGRAPQVSTATPAYIPRTAAAEPAMPATPEAGLSPGRRQSAHSYELGTTTRLSMTPAATPTRASLNGVPTRTSVAGTASRKWAGTPAGSPRTQMGALPGAASPRSPRSPEAATRRSLAAGEADWASARRSLAFGASGEGPSISPSIDVEQPTPVRVDHASLLPVLRVSASRSYEEIAEARLQKEPRTALQLEPRPSPRASRFVDL